MVLHREGGTGTGYYRIHLDLLEEVPKKGDPWLPTSFNQLTKNQMSTQTKGLVTPDGPDVSRDENRNSYHGPNNVLILKTLIPGHSDHRTRK